MPKISAWYRHSTSSSGVSAQETKLISHQLVAKSKPLAPALASVFSSHVTMRDCENQKPGNPVGVMDDRSLSRGLWATLLMFLLIASLPRPFRFPSKTQPLPPVAKLSVIFDEDSSDL